MKIVYCLPQIYKPGGIERIVSIKANYLVEHGYDVSLIFANQKNEPSFYPLSNLIKLYDLQVDYDSTLELPILKRILKKQTLKKEHRKRLEKLLFQLRADIVISTFTHEAEFLPSIKDGSKKILEFHFCRGHKRMMADSFQFSLLTRIAYYYRCWIEENIIIPRFDQFVVLTEEDKDNWINKIPSVINIPNIISFKSEECALLNNKRVIAVGRLDAQKGFDRLIDIWKDVYVQCPDWHLHIYGEGVDKERLFQQIKNNHINHVVFIHKPDNNIIQRYLESSVMVMTSRYEGWGLVLTEAMECGLPCIAYACKSGPKDIISNNIDGFCINENNKKKFVERLVYLLKNEITRKEMGLKARANVQRYSKDKVMKQWICLFNHLVY